MAPNKINQLFKEIKKVEDGSASNIKLWGYGNNRFGQLGLINIKYSKIPIKLEIPENELKMNNDYIIDIICSNTISLLITKKEKIYICGNYNPKEKQNIIDLRFNAPNSLMMSGTLFVAAHFLAFRISSMMASLLPFF